MITHTTPCTFLDLSQYDRVFACGDIHGEYDMLQEELIKVGFNESRDILILVGDLADRGPDSPAALEWIKKPFVRRVLGNHDVAPRMVRTGQLSKYQANGWGCEWFTKLPDDEIEIIARAFEDAPIALTVLTPEHNRIGIVHADCLKDWNDHIASLSEGSSNRTWVSDLSLWSRQTLGTLMEAQERHQPLDTEAARVKNIDHVFHGHTMLAEPFTAANRTWIDTGACMGGKLTVLDVDVVVSDRRRA